MSNNVGFASDFRLSDFGDRCKTCNLRNGWNIIYNYCTNTSESCPSDLHVYTSSPILWIYSALFSIYNKVWTCIAYRQKKFIYNTPSNLQYLVGSDGKRKKLSSGFELLFFEQFTAEHHVFVVHFFFSDGSTDIELAIMEVFIASK